MSGEGYPPHGRRKDHTQKLYASLTWPLRVYAHASHIYQKLGVHSKDEMLELVEDRAAKG